MEPDLLTQAFADLRKHGCDIDSENWTESDTRSKFIDQVLTRCLGWRESDIRRELSSDRKRLDYLLSLTRPVVVVEAKRASFHFKTTSGTRASRVRLSAFLHANPTMREPIEQVAQYCWNWSAPFGVLTNGRSYLLFVAVRTDGTPWQDGYLLVIADVFDPSFNFSDLFELLARDRVAQGKLPALLYKPELVLQR